MTAAALFLGHGNPMNAIEDNEFSRAWRALGERLPRPRLVLCVSAHWETKGVLITAAERPRTIHDFYHFPKPLYDVVYPAPGAPGFADALERRLAPFGARADLDGWGLDHGAWSLLCHLFPKADVPVVQLSMDVRRGPRQHYELGRALAELRDEGVMILGSGNVVHNLRVAFARDLSGEAWSRAFDAYVVERVAAEDVEALVDYTRFGPDAARAVPETEHYLPLLYVLGTRRPGERAEVVTRRVAPGISMTGFAFGVG